MQLTPGDNQGAQQREEPSSRSSVEVYLRGMKSAGSWASFLGYAVVAAVITWVALFRGSTFVLVGAVLVAPYPSPAINVALATARGNLALLLRSALRHVVAVAIGVATAYALTLLAGLPTATDLMRSVSFVSATVIALPLAAGAAAAMYLGESEESSLVSAAAAGVLVTVALVPPIARDRPAGHRHGARSG